MVQYMAKQVFMDHMQAEQYYDIMLSKAFYNLQLMIISPWCHAVKYNVIIIILSDQRPN